MKYLLGGHLLLLCFAAAAHPGVGIVRDAQGNLYYTDLEQVWKREPSGRLRVVVAHVHTHELYLDAQGNLFGEHAWYEGEATNRWGYYVWRLTPQGRLTKIIPNTPGFLSNYSFVRDQAGAMYWVEKGRPCRFINKPPTGRRQLLATGVFGDVRWQYVTAHQRLLPQGFMMDFH
jgi:hypothetical protein